MTSGNDNDTENFLEFTREAFALVNAIEDNCAGHSAAAVAMAGAVIMEKALHHLPSELSDRSAFLNIAHDYVEKINEFTAKGAH